MYRAERFTHKSTSPRALSVIHKKSFVDNRARSPALATLTVAAGDKGHVDVWIKLGGSRKVGETKKPEKASVSERPWYPQFHKPTCLIGYPQKVFCG